MPDTYACATCGHLLSHHSATTGRCGAQGCDCNAGSVEASYTIPAPDREGRRNWLIAAARLTLAAIGENPDRPGLADTPRRYADWWLAFADYADDNLSTVFEAAHTDQMVVVSGIRVWSICEHHLLPFYADLTIGYLPVEQIIGLSKFARIAQVHAHRLQVQERLVEGIADQIEEVSGSDSVAVIGAGEHLCMTMRGIRAPATMHTSVMRGAFLSKPEARAEFFYLAGLNDRPRHA